MVAIRIVHFVIMIYSAKDITIIITCYKEGELLRRAVASVANQTMQGFSILLINDCSPDALTNAICDELAALDGVT
jgi:glycosyltransferase involved in cell wall biosynthesis